MRRVSARMDDAAIRVERLTKSFKDVRALAGIDLEVAPGTVLGLLGPNGAGKTTAVRILATLLPPDSGTARVAGLDVVADAAALRSRIGLAGQYAAVDENLTGRENLEMVGRLYHWAVAPRESGRPSFSSASRSRTRPTGSRRPTPAACAVGSIWPPPSWCARP